MAEDEKIWVLVDSERDRSLEGATMIIRASSEEVAWDVARKNGWSLPDFKQKDQTACTLWETTIYGP